MKFETMKKLVKVTENVAYIIGGIGSIALFHKAVDYANAHRLIEALGGELFVPIVAYAICYVLIRWGSRKTIEYICSLEAVNDPFKHESTTAIAKIDSKGRCKVTSRDGSVVCYSSLGEYLKTM